MKTVEGFLIAVVIASVVVVFILLSINRPDVSRIGDTKVPLGLQCDKNEVIGFTSASQLGCTR